MSVLKFQAELTLSGHPAPRTGAESFRGEKWGTCFVTPRTIGYRVQPSRPLDQRSCNRTAPVWFTIMLICSPICGTYMMLFSFPSSFLLAQSFVRRTHPREIDETAAKIRRDISSVILLNVSPELSAAVTLGTLLPKNVRA